MSVPGVRLRDSRATVDGRGERVSGRRPVRDRHGRVPVAVRRFAGVVRAGNRHGFRRPDVRRQGGDTGPDVRADLPRGGQLQRTPGDRGRGDRPQHGRAARRAGPLSRGKERTVRRRVGRHLRVFDSR